MRNKCAIGRILRQPPPASFVALALFLATLFLNAAAAQSQAPSPQPSGKDWQFEASLYLLASGIDGDAGVGNVDSDIDVGFSDILDHLDVGGMGFFSGRNDEWSFVVDAVYMKLSADASVSRNRSILALTANLDVELEQAVVAGIVGRKLVAGSVDGRAYRIDVLGGARYNSISVELDARVSLLGITAATEREGSVDWIDPVIGVRGEIWPTDKLRLAGWFDYGGFGVGADSTWQALAAATYRATPAIDIIAGYRVYAFDYEEGSGTNRIKLDLTYSGPMIGAAYRF